MKENKRVLDEELSKGKYVTYRDVADLLIKDTSDVVAVEKIEGQLKAYVSRDLKHKGVLDYKNGKNEKYGVKYRQGYEHYLRYIEEKKEFEKMPRAEKRKYATIGLDLLLDQGNTEYTKIEFECVRNLEKADYVKKMATWILERNVLNITYIDKKNKEHKEIFHPQYLREYNNRWAVYGKCEGIEEYPTCIRIDSIVELSLLIKEEGIIYQEAERHYYRDYFKDMIGFTKNKNSKVQNVYFLTNNQEVHNLIKTKPFHESQEELEAWSNETQHGKFVLHIIPNIELRTKLLSYGSGITLEGNGWFQRGFKEEIKKMAELYKNEE